MLSKRIISFQPFVSAMQAGRLVDDEHLPATRAGPFLLFGADELADAVLPDALQVGKHAHPVPCPVAFIQVLQAGAGVAVAFETILEATLRHFFAVRDDAVLAGPGFQFVSPAARTGFDVALFRAESPA